MFFGFEDPLPNQPKISAKTVRDLDDKMPHRVCFATTHVNALKRKANERGQVGEFDLPFRNTVGSIFTEELGLRLFGSKFNNGCYRYVEDEGEFKVIEIWIRAQGMRVFLRDTLALSVALGPNLDKDGNRTEVGELENSAKYDQSRGAIEGLTDISARSIRDLPFYRDAEVLAAVPPGKGKVFDLPSELAKGISESLSVGNGTNGFQWENAKTSLKEEPIEQKWAKLTVANLMIDGDVFNGKKVILIDDLYQSGSTMQYVGSKILEAGAKRVYGFAMVKSRRNTDNQ